jgi:hypothetical protein
MKNFFDKYPTEIAQVIGTILVVVAIIIGFLLQ